MRTCNPSYLRHTPMVERVGLTTGIVGGAVDYVYRVLDSIDENLVEGGSDRFAAFVELATLSAVIGNLFRRGIERESDGGFVSNAPHAYPDLLGAKPGCADLDQSHFNFSNTEGDSGKTAVINARGMNALGVVYCDLDRTPLAPKGRVYAELARLYE